MNMWLTGYLARIIFAASLGAFGVWAATHHSGRFGLKAFALYYGLRLASMFVLVVLVGMIPSDVTGWYMHAGWMAFDGLFPGKGFLTPYYLGMNALLGMSVWLWNSPFSIVAVFTVVEAAAVAVLFRAFSRYESTDLARKVCILYLTSPIVTMCSWFGAQDEPLILLALAVVFYLIVSHKPVWTLAVAAFLGILGSKILAVFFLQPFYFCRRYRSVFLCFGGLVLYILVAHGIGVNSFNLCFGRQIGLSAPADDLIDQQTVGNLWFVFGSVPNIVQNAVLLVALATFSALPLCGMFLSNTLTECQGIKVGITLLSGWGLIFTLFYKMSFAAYAIAFIPFLLYETLRGRLAIPMALVWSWVLAIKDPLYCARQTFDASSGAISVGLDVFSGLYIGLTGVVLWRLAGGLREILYGK